MTKGEREELERLAIAPQPAYVGHGNRSRSGVQMRLALRDKYAEFLPRATAAETVRITDLGRNALEAAKGGSHV